MAEIRLAPPGKRVKCMLPDGSERPDRGQRWAALGCAVSPPVEAETEVAQRRPLEEGAAGVQEEQAAELGCPGDVLTQLKSAREEVGMVIQVVDQIEAGQLGLPEARRQAVIDDLKNKLALQVESQRTDFTRVADILRGGAAVMRERLDRDATYFQEVARLERCWPLDTARAEDGTLRLQLELAAPGRGSRGAGARPPTVLVALPQDEVSGRVTSELPTAGPSTLEGAALRAASRLGKCGDLEELHGALGALHTQLWWDAIKAVAAQEGERARAGPGGSPGAFLQELANKFEVIHGSDVPKRAAYGPVLSLCYLAMLRAAARTAVPGSAAAPEAAPTLGAWLGSWLKHALFRGHVTHMLDVQAAVLPGVRIAWVGPWRGGVSAFHLQIAEQLPWLLVVRDNCVEVEGVCDAEGDLRWVKDSYVRVVRSELPFFVEVLVNTVERLRGVGGRPTVTW